MRDMIRLGQVEPVRKRITEATQTLLGDTIMLTDDQWRAASLLPGWTRAHLATHISRSADALRGAVRASNAGHPQPLYPSDADRVAELQAGATRPGLDLQIDLDTTAGALDEAFAHVEDWTRPVPTPLGEQPLAALVVARYHEVVLHHLDLAVGFGIDRVDPVGASWLLQWAALWVRGTKVDAPHVRLVSESGVTEEIGSGADPQEVTGSDADLWHWLTGRSLGEGLEGTFGLRWPLLG